MVLNPTMFFRARRRNSSKQMKIAHHASACICCSARTSLIILIMTPPPKCCNPFKKEKHNSVKNNLYYLSSKHDKKFTSFFGLYVCLSCKSKLYANGNFCQLDKAESSKNQPDQMREVDEEQDIDEEIEVKLNISEKDEDFVCKAVDKEIKKRELAKALTEAVMSTSAKKLKLNLSHEDGEILRKSIDGKNLSIFSDVDCDSWISDLKDAMSRVSTREQKIVLLTSIPVKWSNRKMAKEFGVSRRMVAAARKLQNEKGFCTHPDKKKGRAMSLDLIAKVEEYYLSDEVSRVMPGVKAFKSVKIDGKRQHKTVSNSVYLKKNCFFQSNKDIFFCLVSVIISSSNILF